MNEMPTMVYVVIDADDHPLHVFATRKAAEDFIADARQQLGQDPLFAIGEFEVEGRHG